MNKVVKRVGIGLLVLIALGFGFTYWVFRPGDTSELERIANQFQPGKGWVLTQESIKPARIACLQADCDSLRKNWTLPDEVTDRESFENIARLGSNSLVLDDDCFINPYTSRTSNQCTATGIIDTYQVTLSYSHYNDQEPQVILNLER